jgi:hypothetical protein
VGDVASWAAVINQADIRLVQHMVGRLRVDPLQIRAEGGALAPALVVALELDVHEADGAKLVLERLAGELWTKPAAGARVRLGQPVTIESAGRGDTRPLFSLPRGGVHNIDLGAPGVRLLDEAVQASTQGPVMLALYFEARLGVLESSQAEDLPSLGNPSTFTVRRFWSARIDELEIQLPREHWAQELAPKLGHDRMRLIAVEMPFAQGPLGGELIALFDAASRAYDAGDWRETIQKCRDVRSHIEQHVRQQPEQRLCQAVAERVGVTDSDPRMRFLDQAWTALAEITNDAHHLGSVGRLEAASAHATLILTATLIQYLGELLG